ncbi:hypothetical protein, partial [Escherichia coli]|uniref:hypothetical protein n=1 Tax=Escherichia coli TaxID=562 RepID=UPI003A4DFFEC
QNDVTLKMPAFEWVHVQLHQQKGMISLSPPTICNSALLSGLKFFGIYRTQKNADITDRLLSVPNSADPKAMYLSTERVPDILGTDVF